MTCAHAMPEPIVVHDDNLRPLGMAACIAHQLTRAAAQRYGLEQLGVGAAAGRAPARSAVRLGAGIHAHAWRRGGSGCLAPALLALGAVVRSAGLAPG
jgi:hypothetical protein